MTERGKATLLVSCSTIFSILACEAGFRMLNDVPVLSASNFRNERVIQVAMSHASVYDPLVGWVVKPYFVSDGFSTIEYGIRKNSASHEEATPGAILVVGSSFTAGSEVKDWETWPAQLEQMLNDRVLNAAVGNFSVDQIVLHAQRLLPVLRPKTLIVEAMDLSITWNGYSNRSRPKPYFTIDNGQLRSHNVPVPALASQTDRLERIKNVAGHFLMIDRVMATNAPDAWYASPENIVTRIQSDEVDVSCRLLAQLKEQADAANVRMMLLTHVAALEVTGSDAPPNQVSLLEECAKAIGVQAVGTFLTFKAVQQRSAELFKSHYMMHGETFGHMSVMGNQLIARVAAEGLRAAPTERRHGVVLAAETFVPGDGHNLVQQSEALHTTFNGSVAAIQPAQASRSPREFVVTPTGPHGEHYIGASLTGLSPGPYTLSFEVAPARTPVMRAQLLDSLSGGVIGDIDFAKQATSTIRYGRTQRLSAGVKALSGGWYRAWISGRLAGAPTAILLQLTDDTGAFNFAPGRETLTIRRVQLERGESASTYQPTETAAATVVAAPATAVATPAADLLQGQPVPGDGRNVVPNAEALDQWITATAHANFSATSKGTPREFEIQARGAAGEHYVASQPLSLPRSAYTLGFDVRPNGSPTLRVQLQETSGASGLVTDIDFRSLTARATRRGQARFRPATVAPLPQGWYRVSITTDLGADTIQVLFQLTDRKGGYAFRPAGEAVNIRALIIETGQTASAYRLSTVVSRR